MKGLVHPFKYNDIEHLTELVKSKSIGVIKMEVYRSIEPQDNFLQNVRELASKNGIVLLFDDVLRFRECFGGLPQNMQ